MSIYRDIKQIAVNAWNILSEFYEALDVISTKTNKSVRNLILVKLYDENICVVILFYVL
jgi:hypothetical protein